MLPFSNKYYDFSLILITLHTLMVKDRGLKRYQTVKLL